MSGVDYRCIFADGSTGRPIAEVPLNVASFSTVLTGCGQLTGTLPLRSKMATSAILDGDREITMLRNENATETVVWNGPVTNIKASRRDPLIQITAREASWYLQRAYVEADKYYRAADVFDIVRDLISTGRTSKTGGSLYGWSVTTGLSGKTKTWAFTGRARYNVLDTISGLAQDPQTAFDYWMDYTTGSTRQTPHRTFKLASPAAGVTQTALLTTSMLVDWGFGHDREQAANRVHMVGANETITLQNGGSISGGDLLLESRFDRTNITSHDVLSGMANEARRLAIPPVKTYFTTFHPGSALPYGWVGLGDKVHLAVDDGYLTLQDWRRVVQITTRPRGRSGEEEVDLTFNLPLDQLGA